MLEEVAKLENDIAKLSQVHGAFEKTQELESLRKELELRQAKESVYKTSMKELHKQCEALTSENEKLRKVSDCSQNEVIDLATVNGHKKGEGCLQRRIDELEADKKKLADDLKAAELKLFFLEVGDKAPCTPPRRTSGKMEGYAVAVLMAQNSPKSQHPVISDPTTPTGLQPKDILQQQLHQQQQQQQHQVLHERVQFLERQLGEMSKKNEERLCVLKNKNLQLISELKAKCTRLSSERTDLCKTLDLATEARRLLDRDMELLRQELTELKTWKERHEADASNRMAVSAANDLEMENIVSLNQLIEQLRQMTGGATQGSR